MENYSPELAAINHLRDQFKKFAALSHEQWLQTYSLLHAQMDLITLTLTDRGFSRQEVDEMIAKRAELVNKHYTENAKNLKNALDALLEAEDTDLLM